MYRLAKRKGRMVQVSFDDGRTWKSTGCKTKAEAIALLSKGTLDIFGDYARNFYTRRDERSYWARCTSRGKVLNQHTIDTKQYRLDTLILPSFGDMRMADITARDIELWFVEIRQPDGEPYASRTKNDILTVFKDILGQAMVDGIVHDNEAKKLKPFIKQKTKKPYLTQAELKLLMPDDDNSLIDNFGGNALVALYFCIFRDTGFRPCEIVALKRSDIRPDGSVYTEWMFDFYTKTLEHRLKTSHNGKDYKVGQLSEQTMRILNDVKGKYLFLYRDDKFDPYHMNRHFKRAVEKVLGRTDLSQYVMRHAFMTNLVSKYPKELVMELMGHTQWEACYDDRTPEQIMDNVRKALSRCQE